MTLHSLGFPLKRKLDKLILKKSTNRVEFSVPLKETMQMFQFYEKVSF